MRNDDPFASWNDPMDKTDPFKPWNDPRYKDDPFAPWNSPFGDEQDLEQYQRDHYIKE